MDMNILQTIVGLCLTALLFWRFYEYLPHFYGGSAILSAVMVLTVLNGVTIPLPESPG